MNANAPRLDYPEGTSQNFGIENREHSAQPITQALQTRLRAKFENHDALRPFRRKPQYLPEIAVQRDERAPFRGADVIKYFVARSLKILVAHRGYIMARRTQKLNSSAPDIFVEFEFHATCSSETGRMRSREASAP